MSVLLSERIGLLIPLSEMRHDLMQRLRIGDISASHLHHLPTTIIIGIILASLDGQELARKIPRGLMEVLTFMKLKMSNGTLDWFLSISLYKIFNAEKYT